MTEQNKSVEATVRSASATQARKTSCKEWFTPAASSRSRLACGGRTESRITLRIPAGRKVWKREGATSYFLGSSFSPYIFII